MDRDQRKEMIDELTRSAKDYLSQVLVSSRTSREAQERKEETSQFILSWLNKHIYQHPLLDDFISSIENKPEKMSGVLEVIGILIAVEIIKIPSD